MSTSSFDLTAALRRVRQASDLINAPTQSSRLEILSDDVIALRIKALAAMGEAISRHQDDILEANTLDLEISRDMAVPDLVVDWLKLTPERVQKVVSIFHKLALTGVDYASGGSAGDSTVQYRTCPVGTVGFMYEAFPDLGAIAAALCICTGNALILKGGSEASRSNRIIATLLRQSLEAVGLPADLIFPIESTEVSRQDVAQCSDIDLIIAHGRPSLVEQVVHQASVRVIPSRMGNCYLYWSASGSLDTVYQMTAESHCGSPDAVNRIEKILIHASHSPNAIVRLWNRLQEGGFDVVADEAISALHSTVAAQDAIKAADSDWHCAYLRKKIALRQVEDDKTAIEWINEHSSGHADSIATTDYTQSHRFINGCRSATVYVNASPKFIRDARRPGAIAIGASNYKGNNGGLISMDVMQVRQRIFHSS